MQQQPWYREGLRFECTQCGDCCTGAPGFVWVNEAEITALAKRFDMPVDEFEKKYVRKIGIRKSLVEFDNGDCVFFDTKARKCTVYENRPRQCKSWPFWLSNTRTEEDWEETREGCPGCGKGRLYSLAEIQTQLKVIHI